MHRKRPGGFTLLEILIASSVLVIFMTGVYKVYRGVTRSFKQTNWSLSMQTHARNGLTFLREEMQRASYKTEIRIGSVDVTETTFMKIKSGVIQADQLLAEWYIGIPFRLDIPGSGGLYKSTVEFSGGKLVYKKVLVSSNDPGEMTFAGRVLMENLHSVELSVNAFDVDSATGSQLVSIAVELRHPDTAQFPNTKVIERTAAKIDVKVGHL